MRKQIAALKGDTSKEGEARSQKLQAQLKDAQDGLKDTEYDRYISDQQNMLDNMYNEYSALLTDLEKDTDKLLQEGLDLFAQTGSDVQDTIRDAADEYNYVITGNTGQIMGAIESLGSMETYLGAGGYVTNALNDIITEIKNAYTAIPTSLNNGDDSVKTGKNEEYDNQKPTATAPSTDLPPTEPTKPDEKGSSYNKVVSTGMGILEGYIYALGLEITDLINHGTGTYSATKSSDLNKHIYKKYNKALTQAEMSELSKLLGLNYTTEQLTSDKNRSKYKTNILKALQSIGLSKGGVVSKGKKLEDYGLKNVSGGTDKIPVVLTAGERVLTPVQNTMWEKWTANMPKLMGIAPKIEAVSKMPELKTNNISSNVKVDYGNVNINLPNVKNYPDFMKCAQKDPNFNRMIDYMVDNHLKGFGSMGKYNVRF